jgi:DNA-binding YbaB/EbfC family protein
MKLPGNLGDLMEQAIKLKGSMEEVQRELDSKTVSASSGGGMVTVTVTGSLELRAVEIDPAVVNPADITMLQDLIRAASNEGLRKAKEMGKAEMMKLTGGLPIPGF